MAELYLKVRTEVLAIQKEAERLMERMKGLVLSCSFLVSKPINFTIYKKAKYHPGTDILRIVPVRLNY